VASHASLGWPDAGQISPRAPADVVTVFPDSPCTAAAADDTALESAIFGATAADVREVALGGQDVIRAGQHQLIAIVPGALAAAVQAVLG
jgi:cytosine/adenosine deaminase-related metal-dependent hydrolase